MSKMIFKDEDRHPTRFTNNGRVVLDDGTEIKLTDQALPTSRLLPDNQQSAGIVEYSAPGVRISDGEQMRVYWLQTDDGETLPENYDWDNVDRAEEVG